MQLEYLNWNKRGLIPGPLESEELFRKRAETSLCLKQEIAKKTKAVPINDEALQSGLDLTTRLYDISPDWAPVFYSNEGLLPWEGAATWITEESFLPLVHLRKSFSAKKTYLGLYKEKELLSHELVHVGRSAFLQSDFEEFLAYKTSAHSLREFLGTFVKSPVEAYIFIAILWLACIALVFGWFLGLAFPLLLIIMATLRSISLKHKWKNAFKNLKKILASDLPVRAVLFRLTDKEISLFSKKSAEEILHYIERESSLRWQIIKAAYFHFVL